MATESHDKHHFFKYTSFETAKLVVEKRSFRWSSPTNFNDPFDHQSGFAVEIEPEHFARLLTESIERVVFSDRPIQSDHSSLAALAVQMRSIRERLPRQRFQKDTHEASLESARNVVGLMDEFSSAIHRHLSRSRVFCVSEMGDNVVMWSHYAEEHRGVVFKLRCVEELDNALLMARPVNYTSSFVPFLSAEQYAMHLTGEAPVDIAELCWSIAFTKHADWSYEKEWRVHLPLLDQPIGDGYSIFEEDDRVFEAIYLGCRMPDQHVDEMCDLVHGNLPETKLFRVKKDPRSFALTLEDIA